MRQSLVPCPRCGAKNEPASLRCYACAALLDANEQAAQDDIPDALLDSAARALREEPAPPPDTTGRMAVALAGTFAILAFGLVIFPLLLVFFAGWVLLPFSKSPELAFYCYLGVLVLALAALWIWALFGTSQN